MMEKAWIGATANPDERKLKELNYPQMKKFIEKMRQNDEEDDTGRVAAAPEDKKEAADKASAEKAAAVVAFRAADKFVRELFGEIVIDDLKKEIDDNNDDTFYFNKFSDWFYDKYSGRLDIRYNNILETKLKSEEKNIWTHAVKSEANDNPDPELEPEPEPEPEPQEPQEPQEPEPEPEPEPDPEVENLGRVLSADVAGVHHSSYWPQTKFQGWPLPFAGQHPPDKLDDDHLREDGAPRVVTD